MERRYETIPSPAVGRDMQMLVYGFYGYPLLVFPSGGGQYFDFENNGMVDAVAPLVERGKIKIYCTEGLDQETWLNEGVDPHWRAFRHNAFQDYVTKDLIPAIRRDCQSPEIKIGVTGCSLGAYHAANFALKFPEVFNYALCMSGRYDIEDVCGKSGSLEVYYNNPIAYTTNLDGEALENVRRHTHLVLVCGQGAWEDKCLRDTHQLADILVQKGISHERDIWGFDVEHHWFWWRKQIIYHLSKAFE